MTPLILRPEPQASELARQLHAAGHSPVVSPLLSIKPGRELSELVPRLQLSDLVIAVSAQAVEQANLHLRQAHLDWPERTYLAVGSTTAESWRESGVSAHYPQDARSEGLLTHARLQSVAGKSILILRGDGGRELLAETLRARGAHVRYCECYQRYWPKLDGAQLCARWHTAKIDSVIITSGELLRRLLELVPHSERDWLKHLLFIVPSARVAALVVEAGLPAPRLAAGATHAALLAALGERNSA
ncbi:MAG: uroporphyrinogen-III synthase [Aeromonadaceae bacterium]